MPDDLADLIRDRRHELGLTQAELGELVGRAPSTIGSWESGRSRPADEETVGALIRVLDLDTIDTAERVPPPPTRPTPVVSETATPTASKADTPAAAVSTVAPPTEPVVHSVRDVPPSAPVVRTDVDPLYRIRLAATIVVVIALGWVAVWALGAAGDVIASIVDSLAVPFRR